LSGGQIIHSGGNDVEKRKFEQKDREEEAAAEMVQIGWTDAKK